MLNHQFLGSSWWYSMLSSPVQWEVLHLDQQTRRKGGYSVVYLAVILSAQSTTDRYSIHLSVGSSELGMSGHCVPAICLCPGSIPPSMAAWYGVTWSCRWCNVWAECQSIYSILLRCPLPHYPSFRIELHTLVRKICHTLRLFWISFLSLYWPAEWFPGYC